MEGRAELTAGQVRMQGTAGSEVGLWTGRCRTKAGEGSGADGSADCMTLGHVKADGRAVPKAMADRLFILFRLPFPLLLSA